MEPKGRGFAADVSGKYLIASVDQKPQAFHIQSGRSHMYNTEFCETKGDVQVSGENCPEPKGTIWYLNY